jgi:hypothetical protein
LALVVAVAFAWLPPTQVLAQSPPAPPVSGQPAADTPGVRQKVLILRSESAVVPDAQRIGIAREVLAQALHYKNLDAVLSGADLVEEMFEYECTEAGVECLGKIGIKYGAQLVLFSEIAKNAQGGLQVGMRVIDVAQSRVAQSTVQPLDNPDKPQQAVQRGLTVLLGPVDMPPVAESEQPGVLQIVLVGGGVALVYVDDKLVGRTSVTGLKATVAAGAHTVRVVRAGFKEWTSKLTVSPGGVIEQPVQLEQLADVAPGGGTIGGPTKPVEDPITRKWWFWGIIGVAVAGTVTAVVIASIPADKAVTGAASFQLDDTEAYKDPIYDGGAP